MTCHSRPSIVQWHSGQWFTIFSCYKCSLQYHHSVAQLVCTKLYYFLMGLSFSSPMTCENHMASKWNRFASWSFSFLWCPSMFTISIVDIFHYAMLKNMLISGPPILGSKRNCRALTCFCQFLSPFWPPLLHSICLFVFPLKWKERKIPCCLAGHGGKGVGGVL